MSTANVLASSSSAGAISPAVMLGGVMPPHRPRIDDKPNSATPPEASAAAAATSILIGIDGRGRPHASRFDAVDEQTIKRAAKGMGFTVMPVRSDAMAELAAKLPNGKLFASGNAFVPFVGQQLFDRLVAYLPISARPLKPAASKKTVEASAANDSGASPDDTAQTANTYAAVKEGSAKPRSGMFPENWDKIRVGQIVLATADRDEGWWTAYVREDKGDGLFALEWEEFEGLGLFLRRREQIALLHPNYDGK